MNCPKCNGETGVTNSRPTDDGPGPRRRRACVGCGHRFTTLEFEVDESAAQARRILYGLQIVSDLEALEAADREVIVTLVRRLGLHRHAWQMESAA